MEMMKNVINFRLKLKYYFNLKFIILDNDYCGYSCDTFNDALRYLKRMEDNNRKRTSKKKITHNIQRIEIPEYIVDEQIQDFVTNKKETK